MKPHVIDDGIRVTWRCLGCRWMMTGPSEQGTDELAAGKHPEGIKATFYSCKLLTEVPSLVV